MSFNTKPQRQTIECTRKNRMLDQMTLVSRCKDFPERDAYKRVKDAPKGGLRRQQ